MLKIIAVRVSNCWLTVHIMAELKRMNRIFRYFQYRGSYRVTTWWYIIPPGNVLLLSDSRGASRIRRKAASHHFCDQAQKPPTFSLSCCCGSWHKLDGITAGEDLERINYSTLCLQYATRPHISRQNEIYGCSKISRAIWHGQTSALHAPYSHLWCIAFHLRISWKNSRRLSMMWNWAQNLIRKWLPT